LDKHHGLSKAATGELDRILHLLLVLLEFLYCLQLVACSPPFLMWLMLLQLFVLLLELLGVGLLLLS